MPKLPNKYRTIAKQTENNNNNKTNFKMNILFIEMIQRTFTMQNPKKNKTKNKYLANSL